MPGDTRELGNPNDMPRLDALTGNEVIPVLIIDEDGISQGPGAFSTNLLLTPIEILQDSVSDLEGLVASGLKPPLVPVRVLTTAAVSATTGMENGDTIDGVVVATGDRIAKAVVGGDATNGIYIVSASGAASRATDVDTGVELAYASFFVDQGTHAGEQWAVKTGTITLGVTAIVVELVRPNGDYEAEVVTGRGPYGSLDARFDANETAITAVTAQSAALVTEARGRLDGLEDALGDRITVGAPSPVAGDGGLTVGNNYILAIPMPAPGHPHIVTMRIRTGGVMKIRRFTLAQGVITFASEVSLTVGTGTVPFNLSELALMLRAEAGDLLGFYPVSPTLLDYTSIGAGTGTTPYYLKAGNLTVNDTFTAPAITTNIQIQGGFTYVSLSGAQDIARQSEEFDSRLDGLETSLSILQTIGKTTVGAGVGGLDSSYLYTLRVPVVNPGHMKTLRVRGYAAGSVSVKRVTTAGSTRTVRAAVELNFAVGSNSYDFPSLIKRLNVQAGDYIAIKPTSGQLAYDAVSLGASATPLDLHSGDVAVLGTYAVATLITTVEIQIGIDIVGIPPTAAATPDLAVGDINFAVEGRTRYDYPRGMIAGDPEDGLTFEFSNSLTKPSPLLVHEGPAYVMDSFRWKPAGAVAETDETVKLWRRLDRKLLTSVARKWKSAAANAHSGETWDVVEIGDSQTFQTWAGLQLLRISAADVMTINYIGSRLATFDNNVDILQNLLVDQGTGGSVGVPNEGRGGWHTNDFSTAGITGYKFNVSGVAVNPIGNDEIRYTTYTNNSSTFAVREVNITAGTGNIVCERIAGVNAPNASGNLIKANAKAGDATIVFSAVATQSLNPLWNGGIDFAHYQATYLGGVTPDAINLSLGENDALSCSSVDGAIAAAIAGVTNIEAIVTAARSAYPSIPIGVKTQYPPAHDISGMGLYSNGSRGRDELKYYIHIWNKAVIAQFGGRRASGIYLIPRHSALDTVHNHQKTSTPVVYNPYTTDSANYAYDGVHPGPGSAQLAELDWAYFKNLP